MLQINLACVISFPFGVLFIEMKKIVYFPLVCFSQVWFLPPPFERCKHLLDVDVSRIFFIWDCSH